MVFVECTKFCNGISGPPRDEQSGETSPKSSTKVYEVISPPEYQENISKLEQENGKLRDELVHLEEEYRSLQTKRLEDVSTCFCTV